MAVVPCNDRPADTPLVAIDFKHPQDSESLRVFADGRRVDRTPSGTKTRHVGTDQLNAIRAALAGTDCAKLPQRLC